MVCLRLGNVYGWRLGNLTAARAWFARAQRLIESEPPCVEQGWIAVASMGCDVDDPLELLAAADLALDRARRFGDLNLEMKALADGGLAHVQAGRIAEGMALLDEAMALACGAADDVSTAGQSACSFFTACYHAGDFGRAGSWAELLRRHGVIGSAAGTQLFLSSHCDSVQATLLMELGRWGDAEALLERSRAEFEQVMQMPSWHPDIALADLRIRQGRWSEAEALLIGKDQSMQALLPAARLHLARGDVALARAVVCRGLRVLGDDRLRAVELLTVLVDAELAAGDVAAAAEAADRFELLLTDVSVPALLARARVAQARVLAASGQPDAAVAALETAVDGLASADLPWLRVMVQLELVRVREQAGDPVAAVEAAAVAGALESFDVVLAPADVALLERLTISSIVSARSAAELTRQGKWWTVDFDGARERGCPTARDCATSPSSCRGRASSATPWIWSIVWRGSTGRLIGALSAMPARCWTHGLARPIGIASSSSGRRPTTRSPPDCSRLPRLARPSWSCSSMSCRRPTAWAAATGGRHRRQSGHD